MSEYRSKVQLKDIPIGELFQREIGEEVWIVEQQRSFMDETTATGDSNRKVVWLSTVWVIPL